MDVVTCLRDLSALARYPGGVAGSRASRFGRWCGGRPIAAAAFVLVALLVAGPALAQEVQVPLDEAGEVQVVDGKLARQLDLFVDWYPNLQEVRLFQLPDTTFVLEVTSLQDGTVVRQREALSPAAIRELRSLVSARLAERAVATIDHTGRVGLIARSALVGLGFYGWAVPEIFDVDDSRSAVALYMLTGAGSIALPWVVTRKAPVTEAMADLAFHGATRGIIRGLMIERLLRGEEREDPNGPPMVQPDDRDQKRLAAALATSLVESVGGYLWARGADMDRGTAYSAGNGSDFGMLAGAAVTGLIQPNDFDRNRLAPALVLTGAAIGAPLGARLAEARGYSHGDAHPIRTAGFLGIAAGLMAVDWTGTDSERPIIAGATLGGLGGLVLGDRLVHATDFEIGPARLVQLATVAGAAVGLGTAYLLTNDDWEDTPTAFLTLGTLGAGAAFGLTYRAFAGGARAGTGGRSNFRIDLLPAAGRSPTSRGLRPGATLNVEYRLP